MRVPGSGIYGVPVEKKTIRSSVQKPHRHPVIEHPQDKNGVDPVDMSALCRRKDTDNKMREESIVTSDEVMQSTHVLSLWNIMTVKCCHVNKLAHIPKFDHEREQLELNGIATVR